MDFESLQSKLNKGEARYLKRTVGRAINECITELIQVRPSDPVEYMGFWMRRYVDSQNYYAKKEVYFDELITVTCQERRMRKAREANLCEAVGSLNTALKQLENEKDQSYFRKAEYNLKQRITNCLKKSGGAGLSTIARDTLSLTSDYVNVASSKDGPEQTQPGKQSMIVTIPSHQESKYSHSSTTTDRSSMDTDKKEEGSSSPTSRNDIQKMSPYKNTLHRNTGKLTKAQQEMLENSSLEETPKSGSSLGGRSSPSSGGSQRIGVVKTSKDSKLKQVKTQRRKKDDSNSSNTLTDEAIVLHRTGSLEVYVGKWKIRNCVVYCYHPILGVLATRRISIRQSQPETELLISQYFAPESNYDHELYVDITFDEEEKPRRKSTILEVDDNIVKTDSLEEMNEFPDGEDSDEEDSDDGTLSHFPE